MIPSFSTFLVRRLKSEWGDRLASSLNQSGEERSCLVRNTGCGMGGVTLYSRAWSGTIRESRNLSSFGSEIADLIKETVGLEQLLNQFRVPSRPVPLLLTNWALWLVVPLFAFRDCCKSMGAKEWRLWWAFSLPSIVKFGWHICPRYVHGQPRKICRLNLKRSLFSLLTNGDVKVFGVLILGRYCWYLLFNSLNRQFPA